MDAKLELEFSWYEDRAVTRAEAFGEQLEEQSALVRDVAMRLAYARSDERIAQDAIKAVEAECAVEVEQELTSNNERATKDSITARVLAHPRRLSAVARYHEARLIADRWEAVYRGIRERGYSLHTLGEMYKAEVLSPRQVRGDAAQESRPSRSNFVQITDDEYETRKEQMAAKRPSLADLKARVGKSKKKRAKLRR